MNILLSAMLVLSMGWEPGQKTYDMEIGSPQNRAWSYEDFSFPTKQLALFTLDKQQAVVKPQGLTLVFIWSVDVGGDARTWSQTESIGQRFAPDLATIWINHENAVNFSGQREKVGRFFAAKTKPKHLFLDPMGSVVEHLKVPSFPSYLLVDAHGSVVFRANAANPEAVAMLEGEIRNLMRKE